MSDKNFMSFGDADTILTEFSNDIKAKQPKILNTSLSIENTTETTVEGSLNKLATSIQNGKTAISSAITNKGVSTSSNATFSTMASNINAIISQAINFDKTIIFGPIGGGGITTAIISQGVFNYSQINGLSVYQQSYIKKMTFCIATLDKTASSYYLSWKYTDNSDNTYWSLNLSNYNVGDIIEKTFGPNEVQFLTSDKVSTQAIRYYSYILIIEFY